MSRRALTGALLSDWIERLVNAAEVAVLTAGSVGLVLTKCIAQTIDGFTAVVRPVVARFALAAVGTSVSWKAFTTGLALEQRKLTEHLAYVSAAL